VMVEQGAAHPQHGLGGRAHTSAGIELRHLTKAGVVPAHPRWTSRWAGTCGGSTPLRTLVPTNMRPDITPARRFPSKKRTGGPCAPMAKLSPDPAGRAPPSEIAYSSALGRHPAT